MTDNIIALWYYLLELDMNDYADYLAEGTATAEHTQSTAERAWG